MTGKISNNLQFMRRGLLALAIAFPLIYVVVEFLATMRDYRTTVASAESRTRDMTSALKEHATNSISEADRVLRATIADVEQSGLQVSWENRNALERLLKRHINELLPQIDRLYVINREGWLIASDTARLTQPIDVRDRHYYQYRGISGDMGLFLSPPYRSRVNNRPVFSISRAIANADGSLNAIVLVTIRLDYFNEFYHTLGAGDEGHVALMHADGWVLATSIGDQSFMLNMATHPLFSQAKHHTAGTFRIEDSSFGDAGHILSYERLQNYPLLVSVAVDENDILELWRERRNQRIFIGVVSITLMLVLIAVLRRHLGELLEAHEIREKQRNMLAELNLKLEQQAIIDELTGLHNRRYFNEVFPREFKRARRTQNVFVFCILDVDNFKKYNDRYGHPQGDLILQQVAQVLRASLQRASDFVFRLGGEEFGLVCEAQDADAALQAVEVARRNIEQLDIVHADNPAGVVTASFGLVCVYVDSGVEPQAVYALADEALYEAKAAGRNCIVRKYAGQKTVLTT